MDAFSSSATAPAGKRLGFVNRYGITDDSYVERAAEVVKKVELDGLKTVRFSFVDQHGTLRSKTLVASEVENAFITGVSMVSSLLTKDTSDRGVTAWYKSGEGFGEPAMDGAGDIVMVPDPATFRLLPWTSRDPGGPSGWLLCDIYFTDGRPVQFSTRGILTNAIDRLHLAGYSYVAGLEVEFHVFKIEDPKLQPEHSQQPSTPSEVSLISHGYRYLAEQRYDEIDPLFQLIRETLESLELPVRSLEAEFGPSQFEITLSPQVGVKAADNMVLLRSAIKQVCRRHGFHATFMCRPGIPNLFSSGWHLHQSLQTIGTDENAFISRSANQLLSEVGRHFVAGILEHAAASCVFTTPTINGYKRYQPYTLAPDRICWSRDNRAAMLRIVGGLDDPASRIENRVGEPAANPYLYFASQIFSGLDGISRKLQPAPPSDTPYLDDLPKLPRDLVSAISALSADDLFRDQMGEDFINYIISIKQAEVSRFFSSVTDWEQREYFEIF